MLVSGDCILCMTTSGNKDYVARFPHGHDVEWGKLDYFYLLHLFEAEIGGYHFHENVCLLRDEEALTCGERFIIFAIKEAKPMTLLSADGYLGLGLGHGINGTATDVYNTLG